MIRLLNISRYHWVVVLAIAGLFAAMFAFASYNLFHLSMANLSFLQRYGLMAVQEGALIQTIEVLVGGTFALLCYFGFKLCEADLIRRFRLWSQSQE